MRCADSLMLWCLQKMQEYWWYVEAFRKRPEREELVQTPERIAQVRCYEHPVVAPQDSHLRQVPFRTRVSEPHSGQGSPS